MTALSAGVFTNCEINKLINVMTGLASVEGLSTLGARGGMSFLTLWPKVKAAVADEEGSSY
jgi:hypothetical protein